MATVDSYKPTMMESDVTFISQMTRSRHLLTKEESHSVHRAKDSSTTEMADKLSRKLSSTHLRPLTAAKKEFIRELTTVIKEVKKEKDMSGGYRIDTSDESGDSDWSDTDIEMEERIKTPYDVWGKMTYRKTCRRLAITPISFIERNLNSTSLSVKERGLKPRDTLALCHALMVNTTVSHLNLSGNSLGDCGMKYLAWMLADNTNIKTLSLSHNKLGSESAVLLKNVLTGNSLITQLNLSGNFFSDKEIKLFAQVLEETKTLQEVDLSHNNFGDASGRPIGRAIASNDSIRKLNLSWNKFRSRGGVSILRGTLDNVMLKHLNLSMNGISNEGAISAAQAIRRNEGLHELDISNNRIYDEGIMSVARALGKNETLQILRVSHNPITTLGTVAMLNGIKKNEHSALVILDLSCVHVHRDCTFIEEEIRETRPKFKLVLGGVINSDKVYEEMMSDRKGRIVDKNPLTVLRWYISSHNYRLIDIFKQFDKDGSMSVSREEFIIGLQAINVPLTQAQLDDLISKLDTNGDGEIDFKELSIGDQEHRRATRKRVQQP